MKQCNRCNEWRPLDDFHKGTGKPESRRQPCRYCRTVSGGLTRRHQGPPKLVIDGEEKFWCSACKCYLPRDSFSFRADGRHHNKCKPCAVQSAKHSKIRNENLAIERRLTRAHAIPDAGTYRNSQASREELIRGIVRRYQHYADSEIKRLRKRLGRRINAGDKELQRRFQEAKRVKRVSVDEFLDFVLAREPFCECCGKALDMTIGSTDFAIDHFHDTGLLRGLLCNPCNLGLGSFNDDLATVVRAQRYLEHHHAKRNLS